LGLVIIAQIIGGANCPRLLRSFGAESSTAHWLPCDSPVRGVAARPEGNASEYLIQILH
jgi:hypothetical protein